MSPVQWIMRCMLALSVAPLVAVTEAPGMLRLRTRPVRVRWTRRRETAQALLSPAQKRIWALQQVDPSSPLFNRSFAVRLSGELNRAALERAVTEIVRRHESLRTVFRDRRSAPLQVVLPSAGVALDFLDLRLVPRDAREAEVRRMAAIESRRAFDLARGPVLRAKIFQVDQREHLLLVVTHHIVFDAWSENVFLRELQQLYPAFARRLRSPLRALPFQYSDFVAWQQRRLQGDDILRQIANRCSELSGMPSSLKLPADYPRQGSTSSAAGVCQLELPAGLAQDLKEFSCRERVNLFTTLLAAFQFLLAYHSDQDDIVVGVPAPGRTPAQTEALIGCFENALVFRTSLSGNPTVRELLARVRETASRAYANQDASIEKIMEELRPERRDDPWPLFQVMFQLHDSPPAAADVIVQPFEFDSAVTAGIDLNLEIQQAAEGLRCSLRYDSALFRRETAERIIEHFRNLLEALVRNPERRIWELPILSEAERRRLLELNDTAVEFPAATCIHELFERQVEKTPDAVAVLLDGRQLTYRELNRRSNQLANHMRGLGAGPETLVGICIRRSLDMLVGLLGVLKSGAAYVPLDPDYPLERLAFVIEDARTRILLTEQALLEKVVARSHHVLCLDTDWERMGRESGENPASGVSPENLAYVIYTSGSTGKPKGVMIEHRSACNYLFWKRDYFRLAADDRLLQRASFTFDDSVWEFFEPLMVGATVVMLRPGSQVDNGYIVDLMVREKITVACFVPSMLRIMLEEPRISECASLRRFETGAEALPVEVRDRFLEKLPVVLYNGYGPTEATVACTVFPCRPGDKTRPIPIGRPIANTRFYILGRHRQLMPLGAVGELFIGGAGLARGYLNRPELTAEKFVPDPFSGERGARLYRTGDLARYLPDGNVEFIGRLDHQVKVRGFRIELEEVEQVLRQYPALREVAAAACQDQAGDTTLVAYFVPQPGRKVAGADLREFLRDRLPGYMVPAVFVEMASLPYLTSGKLDRVTLSAPEPRHAQPDKAVDALQTSTEKALAEIWSKVLGASPIGRNDDFFALGGHSASAARVILGVRKTFRIEVELFDLFRYPTLAGMSSLIDSSRS